MDFPAYEPSVAELEILAILWRKQPLSVREIHEFIRLKKEVGYTTVLKQVQRLSEKGILERDDTDGKHRYSTALPERQTRQNLAQKLLHSAFGGSAAQLMMHALGHEAASPAELLELKTWLDQQIQKS